MQNVHLWFTSVSRPASKTNHAERAKAGVATAAAGGWRTQYIHEHGGHLFRKMRSTNMEWCFVDSESTHRGQLLVRSTGTHGYGLYTLEPIPEGAFVGIWTGRQVEIGEWEDDRYGLELRYDAQRATVLTPVEDRRVDFSKHPFAALNEPSEGGFSNVCVCVEEHDDNGVVCLVAAFYAAVRIEPRCELLWHYGSHYRRDYAVGLASLCPAHPHISHDHFRAVLRQRPDGVYRADDNSDSSNDEDWRPVRRVAASLARRDPRLSRTPGGTRRPDAR